MTESNERTPMLVSVGGGYSWIPGYFHAGNWSASVHYNWVTARNRLQLGLGVGVRGVQRVAPVTFFHQVTVPIEFRLGGPGPFDEFTYMLIGGSVGYFDYRTSSGRRKAGAVQPLVIGIGSYGAIGETRFIVGGELRSEITSALLRPVAPLFDAQLFVGYLLP